MSSRDQENENYGNDEESPGGGMIPESTPPNQPHFRYVLVVNVRRIRVSTLFLNRDTVSQARLDRLVCSQNCNHTKNDHEERHVYSPKE